MFLFSYHICDILVEIIVLHDYEQSKKPSNKNLSETDFEKKVNSIKVKIKDAVVQTSPKQSRKRDYVLHFSSPVVYPPALPQVGMNKDLFNQPTTEYSSAPFSFYHEEIEETYPVPNAVVPETELPIIQEPQEGMHPYGFDQIDLNTRRAQPAVQDIKPRFLVGKGNPMRTFNQTPPQEKVLTYQDLNSSAFNLSLLTYICIVDYPLNNKTKKQLWKRLTLCPLVETLILKNVGIGGIGKNARFPNLRFCDLSQNRIKTFRSIRKITKYSLNLELTPSMRFVNLNDNIRMDAYRQRLIYITRNLKGTNRMIGLVQIDDTPITKEERIKAIEVHEPTNPNSASIFRWKILLIERFGHKQLQTIPDYLSLVKSVTFPRLNLALCDVSMFLNAQVVDFSGNQLTSFTGLQHLKHLRILYLNDNPDLDTNAVLQQLANTETLESFSFHVSNKNTHPRLSGSREYRASILKQLIPKNRNLLLIDSTTINFNERVDAYAHAGYPTEILDNLSNLEIFAIRGNPNMKSPQDRLQLIGLMHSMKQIDAPLKVIDTEITIYDKVEGWKLVGGALKDAEQFKLAYITGIKSINLYDHTLVNLELCDCALEYLDVSPYVNLKTLLLPNNRFKSLDNLHSLVKLTELFALDIRHNELASAEDVKTHILQMPNLQVLGIFGNPFTKNSNNYRVKFLCLLPPIYQTHKYPLSVLDVSEITPEEIYESSINSTKADSSIDRKENLFNIALLRRASSLEYSTLTEIDLRGCGLSSLFFNKLPQLVVLNLSDNSITDSNLKESAIHHLQSLKALDLRNNKFKDLAMLCKIIDLLNVETLFIEENSCYDKDTEKDRIRFFKKLTNSKIQTNLKFLNGVEVTPKDLAKFGKTKARK
ncbi:hypothetical protein PPL_06235 [Heterostelium album PN500]|uniref:Leucine-rich repeat-containing protein n=1 Tax=Heterostelium pallidum (strain ATCC 26659 / Pp 5 / PN500) TaxID=670386 RepID=D3BCL0_HETP5|nr:hypothetical protein PPL_06235 [Heterostelium album PN500]EFA80652.1 hypothetical protein PPL_06235 [Heterostelium album PN500]|eukprot:XP_020432772.1 hypothetical protein PPL_06235 [Heterostelium album PN500]